MAQPPNLERFTPSTKLNPYLSFCKCPTPTYRVVFEKPSTPPHQCGGGRNYGSGSISIGIDKTFPPSLASLGWSS